LLINFEPNQLFQRYHKESSEAILLKLKKTLREQYVNKINMYEKLLHVVVLIFYENKSFNRIPSLV
jgi:hypothetical protein